MKDLFSSLKTRLLGGGGQQTFNSENKLYREEELLNNCNFDSLNKNDLQGGDLYLSTVTSAENHIGGGRLICHLRGLMFKPSLVGGVF